jgi:hypothetical protein
MNGAIFRSYVENLLRPTLQPDNIVIMDNLGSHRGRAVRAVSAAVKKRAYPARRLSGAAKFGCWCPVCSEAAEVSAGSSRPAPVANRRPSLH